MNSAACFMSCGGELHALISRGVYQMTARICIPVKYSRFWEVCYAVHSNLCSSQYPYFNDHHLSVCNSTCMDQYTVVSCA